MSETSLIALDRRSFIKAGAALAGSLIIDFAIPLGECPAFAQAAPEPFAPNAFIRIDRQNVVTLVMPMAEMGQGVYTAMAMLLAEELEVGLEHVRLEHAPPDDALYANSLLQSQTTGLSSTIRAFWVPLRQAGAVARTMLIAAAAQQWSVDAAGCHAERGAVVHAASSRRLAYGELVDAAAQTPRGPGEDRRPHRVWNRRQAAGDEDRGDRRLTRAWRTGETRERTSGPGRTGRASGRQHRRGRRRRRRSHVGRQERTQGCCYSVG